jgi:hypothetical protein
MTITAAVEENRPQVNDMTSLSIMQAAVARTVSLRWHGSKHQPLFPCHRTKALFGLKNILNFKTIALLFVFDLFDHGLIRLKIFVSQIINKLCN